MATNKATSPGIDLSDLVNFPNGRIKDDTGIGNGTPVNRFVYSDLHEFFAKVMRMASIAYNGLPESESNGYQLVQAVQALAGKNDIITTLNTSGGVVQVGLNLGTLQLNEAIVCKSAFNFGSETTIKGSDGVVKTLTLPLNALTTGKFLTNDYVRLINTSAGVTLVRLGDVTNIDMLVTELLYLKACSDVEAILGTITNKAVTPHALLAAFKNWVTGSGSTAFLATDSTDGLMSAADKTLLDSLNNPIKNVGWLSGVDVGGGTVGTNLPVHGDITQAQITFVASDGSSGTWRITFAHAMTGPYRVGLFIESQGTIAVDGNIQSPVYSIFSSTQFDIHIAQDAAGGVQSLKIHIEVVAIT